MSRISAILGMLLGRGPLAYSESENGTSTFDIDANLSKVDAALEGALTAKPPLTVEDLGYPGLVGYFAPMTKGPVGSTLEMQNSLLQFWDFSEFGIGLLTVFPRQISVHALTGTDAEPLQSGIDVNVDITANTSQQGASNVVGVGTFMAVSDPGAGGQIVDEIHGFEAGFGAVDGATINEFLAYRVHFSGTGGTRGSHIAFCSNTSTTNFALNKGLFVSANYEYALDLNPAVASCLGTAPICHSTQNGRRLAPTILDGWYTGTGDPNGHVTANVGSFYSRRDGGTGSTFYVKESGAGNTGWVAK